MKTGDKIKFIEVCNPEFTHEVEIKEVVDRISRTDIELRGTKSNLLNHIHETEIVKPRRIEIWKSSGNCVLWFGYRAKKSFSQYSHGTNIKLI